MPEKISDSEEKRKRMQCLLQDFGLDEARPFYMDADDDGEEAGEGLGAGAFANSLDHSDLRLEMMKALKDYDEVALAGAIDVARELGAEYPFQEELEKAEAALFDMMQCPDQSI